uniref:PD-(D/E)XK nuclease superfamily protein n=1 Tax=Siphoviridae sp. ctZ1O5 TaxID=2825555 RepID=A0A8S5PEU3_9CAUD|nr:MAG TPA: PD-(D/E)XK nuclease superfamily protein [Siphoviridae sp. ctZ1O5]
MPEHENRAHALLSASGSHRWMACPPSARLEECCQNKESDAAKEGTVAHELCELKVKIQLGEDVSMSEYEALKENPLFTKEMDACTNIYADYCIDTAKEEHGLPLIEVELDLSSYIPEGFGTVDCVIVSEKTLHVIDFKYGRGVEVSPVENSQLMIYALGAYDLYSPIYDFETVKLTIVQPRLSAEPKTWECDVQHLLDFAEKLKPIADLAFKGGGEFTPSEHTCLFCKAKYTCRARADKNISTMFLQEKDPYTLSNDEIGEILAKVADFPKWIKDLEDYALEQLLAGKEIKGYKAVEGRSSRVWSDEKKAFEVIIEDGTEEKDLYETTPLSLAKIEKLLGKKKFASLVGEYVTKSQGKPTLTLSSDIRPSIQDVKSMFTEEGEN